MTSVRNGRRLGGTPDDAIFPVIEFSHLEGIRRERNPPLIFAIAVVFLVIRVSSTSISRYDVGYTPR